MEHLSNDRPAARVPRRAWRAAAGIALCGLLLPEVHADARPDARTTLPHGVVQVEPQHLDVGFWIARTDPDAAAADRATLDASNARLRASDPSVHDLEALPSTLERDAVRAWLAPYAGLPAPVLYDARGREIAAEVLRAALANAALDAVPERIPTRVGLVTGRADLRALPTALRAFRSPDDHDLDRLQESALFPGTPVAVLHESADRRWWFVLSPLYAAWIEQRHVALGAPEDVFGYGRTSPALVVTGARVETVHTPEAPDVSRLVLDMGVRVPLLVDWPPAAEVNGQHPYASHVIELPQRGPDGRLQRVPALLPRSADVAHGPLPLTPANVLRQGFKFLGERYGWGHAYGGRDCSGFVSEVYRSFGVTLPRNTGDQARSEAFQRIPFEPTLTHAQRLERVRTLEVGDLVYIPGHVMMVIGRDRDLTYVIHDTAAIHWIDAGVRRRVKLNSVAVTPLEPLVTDEGVATVERITAIQRIRPRTPNASATE